MSLAKPRTSDRPTPWRAPRTLSAASTPQTATMSAARLLALAAGGQSVAMSRPRGRRSHGPGDVCHPAESTDDPTHQRPEGDRRVSVQTARLGDAGAGLRKAQPDECEHEAADKVGEHGSGT